MLYLWLHCGGRYGRKKPNTSFWGILLVSVMSGEAITKEACVFAEKLPKHGLTFCRISVLELCSLATEGTQEFGFWKESGICNTHHKTSFAYYRRDARIPTAKRFCRFATMRVANSRLSMLPNSEIRQNDGSSGKPNRTKVGNPNEQDTISYLQIYIITLFYKPFIFA